MISSQGEQPGIKIIDIMDFIPSYPEFYKDILCQIFCQCRYHDVFEKKLVEKFSVSSIVIFQLHLIFLIFWRRNKRRFPKCMDKVFIIVNNCKKNSGFN